MTLTSISSGSGVAQKHARRRTLAGLFREPLAWVVVRRLLMSIPMILVVTALSFMLTSLIPGDAAVSVLGPDAPPEAYERLRGEMGLDLPLYERYWLWLSGAVTGELGTSLSGQAVADVINQRLPVTLSLMLGALLLSVVAGVSLGMFSAVRGGVLGRMADTFTLVGFAVPPFWAGAILIALFAVNLGWLPATGYVSFGSSPSLWLMSLVLPVVALSLNSIAALAKQTREAMLDVLGSEYIRMARANGIGSRSIVLRHALKNSGIRVVTVLGIQAIGLLGGAVVIESVFAMPGLGSLIVEATLRHDLPVLQGVVAYVTVGVVAINLVIDLSYSWLNKKVSVR